MSISFSGFCDELGAPLHNKNWSWCAKSKDGRFAVFTVWEDFIQDDKFDFPTKPRASDTRKKAGRTELIRVLDDVIDQGIAAYGIRSISRDINANPRKRVGFDCESLLDLRVTRSGGTYIGHIVGHVPPAVLKQRARLGGWNASLAINDIESDAAVNPDPEYKKRMAGHYVRLQKVRSQVLKRAKGKCEACGAPGFVKVDGSEYLETHHIISLSEEGPDTTMNVIALCPNDHRRAHFGEDWKALQDHFSNILSGLK